MKADPITQIGIDTQGRLFIKPASLTYPMIYREANGVQWNPQENQLFSDKPREWSYLDWFKQIINTADPEGIDLEITNQTEWINIPEQLHLEMLNWMKNKT